MSSPLLGFTARVLPDQTPTATRAGSICVKILEVIQVGKEIGEKPTFWIWIRIPLKVKSATATNCTIAILCGQLERALTNTFRTPLWPHAVMQPGKVTNKQTKEKASPKNTLCCSEDFEKKYLCRSLRQQQFARFVGFNCEAQPPLAGKETTHSVCIWRETQGEFP